jgi:hypothetical protein
MNPFNNVNEAVSSIDAFEGNPEEFVLAISDNLQDPIGINMSIITDRILAKGWEPNGFEQKNGFRLYLYKRME